MNSIVKQDPVAPTNNIAGCMLRAAVKCSGFVKTPI